MTRTDELFSMNGATLIRLADKLGVKAACNRTRTQLKEKKENVVNRILEAEKKISDAEAGKKIEKAAKAKVEKKEKKAVEPKQKNEKKVDSKATDEKKEVVKVTKEDVMARKEEFVTKLNQIYGLTPLTADRSPNLITVKFGKKSLFEIRVARKHVTYNCREVDVPEGTDYHVINNFYLPAVIKTSYEDVEVLDKLISTTEHYKTDKKKEEK